MNRREDRHGISNTWDPASTRGQPPMVRTVADANRLPVQNLNTQQPQAPPGAGQYGAVQPPAMAADQPVRRPRNRAYPPPNAEQSARQYAGAEPTTPALPQTPPRKPRVSQYRVEPGATSEEPVRRRRRRRSAAYSVQYVSNQATQPPYGQRMPYHPGTDASMAQMEQAIRRRRRRRMAAYNAHGDATSPDYAAPAPLPMEEATRRRRRQREMAYERAAEAASRPTPAQAPVTPLLDDSTAVYEAVVANTPLAEPMPVPTHGNLHTGSSHKSSAPLKVLIVVLIVLALAGAAYGVYASGLWNRAMHALNISAATDAATPAGTSAPTVKGIIADNTTTLLDQLATGLEISVVLPDRTDMANINAPAQIVISLDTKATVSAVVLLTEDNVTINAVPYSNPEGEGLTWKVSAKLDDAKTGKVRLFLKDREGSWVETDGTEVVDVFDTVDAIRAANQASATETPEATETPSANVATGNKP